jgi:membrane-associated phospholipid phosphatase
MIELLQFDDRLFHFINSGLSNPFFDAVMPVLRNKYTWMPLYMFLLSFLLINFKKKGLFIVLALALIIGAADSTSSHVIKKSVKRLRPCKVIEKPADLHLLVPCGSGYSFPSSHAANHFAIAVFLGLVFGKIFRWVRWPLLLWAAGISLAQVYVGLHFPLDVTAGALLGSLLGWGGYRCFKRFFVLDNCS